MFGPSSLPRTLAAALRDVIHTDVAVRRSVLHDLALLADGEQRDDALRILEQVVTEDESASLRSSAALLLSDVRAVDSVPCLFRAMSDPSLMVRQNALLALGELVAPAQPEPLERPAQPRQTAKPATVCADLESTRVELWSWLRQCLVAVEPELRFQALIAAARSRHSESNAAVLRALSDRDAKVRTLALRLVDEYFTDPERAESRSVLAARLKDPEVSVRVAAALLLAPSGDETACRIAVAALNEQSLPEEPADVQALLELAGELKLTAAIPGLRRLVRGRFGLGVGRFEFQARTALARLGDENVLRDLARGLRSFSRERRRLAVVLVGEAQLVQFEAELRRLGASERVDVPTIDAALKQLWRAKAPPGTSPGSLGS
jgi:HEAT repeat protein